MGLKVTVPPVEEPVSVADQKAHMRVDGADEDALIAAQIVAARDLAEARICGRLITQTLEWTLDGFRPRLELPVHPVQSITSITYVDLEGVTQTLAPALYKTDLDTKPALIVPAYLQRWPCTRREPGAVTVTFVAGFGAAADVPFGIVAAVKLIAAHLHAARGDGEGGLPATADALLRPHALWSFG